MSHSRKKALLVLAAVLFLPAFGAAAYAAAHAVSDNPAPQRIIPVDHEAPAAVQQDKAHAD